MIWLTVRSFLGRIPRWAWFGLAAGVLILIGVRWYHGKIEDAEKRGAQRENARLTKKALDLKARVDALTAQISTALREKHNEDVRRITGDATDLLVRGPGAAGVRCSGTAGGSSGYKPPSGPGNAAVAAVPSGEGLAVVPWAGTVNFGRVCDLNRAEVLSWRAWREQVERAWPKP